MKIPKYIEQALQRQERAGKKASDYNSLVFEWLEQQGIFVPSDDIYCINSIMIITEPHAYADGIRNLIREHKGEIE